MNIELHHGQQHSLCGADGLIDSKLQQDLLSLLTDNETAPEPTTERWEQRTVDDAANAHPSWGFKSDVLSGLKHEVAVMEVHARLRKLYPDVDIYHMPANDMQVGLYPLRL